MPAALVQPIIFSTLYLYMYTGGSGGIRTHAFTNSMIPCLRYFSPGSGWVIKHLVKSDSPTENILEVIIIGVHGTCSYGGGGGGDTFLARFARIPGVGVYM